MRFIRYLYLVTQIQRSNEKVNCKGDIDKPTKVVVFYIRSNTLGNRVQNMTLKALILIATGRAKHIVEAVKSTVFYYSC